MRGIPCSNSGGFSAGVRGRASGKRPFLTKSRGLRKKLWGARSSFPSSSSSTATATRMVKKKTADGTTAITNTKKMAAGGGHKLVIVESPAKARTIQKFLDSKFVVESCMGHVRDLPKKARDVPNELKATYGKMLGVDADNGFAALYVTMDGKEAVIKKLKDKLKGVCTCLCVHARSRARTLGS